MKTDLVQKINRIPTTVAGDVGATTSIIQVTNLVVAGPYLGDFQITGGGRLIVGDNPDIGARGILSNKGIFGYNTNGVQIFAANFQDYDGRYAGDLHIGNLGSSYLAYKQRERSLGLYNTQGAGFLVQNDGTLQAGHDTGAHMKWDAADGAWRIIVTGAETPIKAEINANGDAYFEGEIRASGGRIYGTMAVDDVLRAGDVDGPAVYLGRFERDTGTAIVRTSEIIATDDQNLPWLHAVAGGEMLPGYFHLGGSGDYGQYLEYDGTSLVTDGTFISAGGRFRVDSTGLSFTEGANEYLEVKPTSSIFMRIQTTGASSTYNAIRIEENSGIAGYFSGGYVGVYGKSTSNQIGVWGYSGSDKAVYGLTDSGVGGTFLATGGGRGVVGSTNSATLGGIVARNTGGGPALKTESSYADFEYGLIVNNGGGSAAASDFRVEGDTDTHLIFADASADFVGISEAAPNATLDVNGTTRLGDSDTNYAAFDATGHLTFAGTAKPWNDILIEPVARTTGTNAPTFEKWYDDVAGSSRGIYLYSFDDAAAGSEKEVFFNLQMSHAWDGGSIQFHVHWIGAVDDTTATPRWGLEYAWKEPGGIYGDTTIVYATGNHLSEADITAHKHYITIFTALAPGSTADDLSSVLIGRLFRNSSDAADTYNATGAKCGLLYIDAHYQLARIGSTDEYSA